MSRARVWKAKDPGFRRLIEEWAVDADRLRAQGEGWRAHGLLDWPISRVLWRLAAMGLPCAREEVFQEASDADSPYALASLWALRTRAKGEAREFLELATEAIWPWVFPSGGGPEADFVAAADLAIEDEVRGFPTEKEALTRRLAAAKQVAEQAARVRPEDPAAWVAMMEARCRVSVSIWAAELMPHLAVVNLIAETLELAERWAPIAERERFLSEAPILLALLHRDEEARQRIAELQRAYPRSLAVTFMIGEALITLGEREEGYAVLERAMALAEGREERLWIREHLASVADLIDGEDAADEAPVPDDPLEGEELDEEDVPAPIVGSERVGRNDPCTCGSGKKYKKCCGKGG